jgi:hypothetical protein
VAGGAATGLAATGCGCDGDTVTVCEARILFREQVSAASMVDSGRKESWISVVATASNEEKYSPHEHAREIC